MNFQDAVRNVFSHYADFQGRARRSEYWYFVLFYFIVSIVLNIIGTVIHTSILSVLLLGFIVPALSVGARRLHDTGRSGWWQLLGLIPLVGAIILIVWDAGDSHPDNQYGPSPKGQLAAGGAYPPPPPGYGQV